MKLPVVEMGDRIVGRGLEHAIELLAGEREAPGLRIERGVLANERQHPGLEVVGALDQVRSFGFLPVALPQQLLGGVEALLESYRVAEEERLQLTGPVENLRAVAVAGERDEVPVVHVRQLVAEDGGELRLVLETAQESGVDEDAALRHGERGQGRIAENDELDDGPARSSVEPGQLGRNAAQVLAEERILVNRHPREEALLLALGLAPQPAFVGRRGERGAAGPDGWNATRTGCGHDSDEQRAGKGAGAPPHVSSAPRVADEPGGAGGVRRRRPRPAGTA